MVAAMKATIVPALFASLLLGGCASNTLSKDECRSVDWRTIGYEDGVAGRDALRSAAGTAHRARPSTVAAVQSESSDSRRSATCCRCPATSDSRIGLE